MTIESIALDVCALNNMFQNGSRSELRPFLLETDGDGSGVSFLGQCLWDSENDDREKTEHKGSPDGKEPLFDFLLREANKILTGFPSIIRDSRDYQRQAL